jgi:hypothetical protein
VEYFEKETNAESESAKDTEDVQCFSQTDSILVIEPIKRPGLRPGIQITKNGKRKYNVACRKTRGK